MKTLQILVLAFCLVVVANAQKAILTGTVYDAVGAVIPKAKVTAVDEKGIMLTTETNEDGIYNLNLPYNKYELKNPSISFRLPKYEIIVDRENWGFEKRVIKDFRFVPAYSGKMFLDVALDAKISEPCGYGGANCLQETPIEINEIKISDKVLQKPLVKLPKTKNNKEEK